MDRRVCRDLSDSEAKRLSHDITNNVILSNTHVDFHLFNYRYYRNVLVLRASEKHQLSDQVSNTDPAHTKDGYFDSPNSRYEMCVFPCIPLVESPAAQLTADVINEFIQLASDYLATHPINVERRLAGKPEANLVITRNASGEIPQLPKFRKTLGMIVEMPGERAVGELIGAKFIDFSYLQEPSIEFYERLANNVISRLQQVEVLYVHTKGPDEPGHDGDHIRKAQVLELIDSIFLKRVLQQLSIEDMIVIVTSDHATPCDIKIHSADPVPIAIMNADWKPDSVSKYSESDCMSGSLGIVKGKDLLSLLSIF